jgi:hypothetical protein
MNDREHLIYRIMRDASYAAAEKRARANDIATADICDLINRARNGDNEAIAELRLRGQNQNRTK